MSCGVLQACGSYLWGSSVLQSVRQGRAVSTALSGRSWALVGASFFGNWELLLCLWVEAFSIKEARFSEDKFGGA